MDIVLLVLAIVFNASKETHKYTAIIVLGIIGLIISFVFMIAVSWVFVFDVLIYGVVLLLCGTANNKA